MWNFIIFIAIERAEADFQTCLESVEHVKISQQEFHKLQWELHQRLNEINDLQQALSDSQTFLFEERKQLLKVIAENDELRGCVDVGVCLVDCV